MSLGRILAGMRVYLVNRCLILDRADRGAFCSGHRWPHLSEGT